MNKKIIGKEYKKKIRLISEYNEFYYDKSSPKISDQNYDELKKDILVLEIKYPFLKSNKSPSKTIGYKPSKKFKKALHRVPMLSLANAFNEDDLIFFLYKSIK